LWARWLQVGTGLNVPRLRARARRLSWRRPSRQRRRRRRPPRSRRRRRRRRGESLGAGTLGLCNCIRPRVGGGDCCPCSSSSSSSSNLKTHPVNEGTGLNGGAVPFREAQRALNCTASLRLTGLAHAPAPPYRRAEEGEEGEEEEEDA